MGIFNSKKEIQLVEELKVELQRAQSDLNDVSTYLDDFLSFLPIAVCDVSPSGMIVNLNKTLENLTGFTSTNLIGEHITRIFVEKSEIKDTFKSLETRGIIENKEFYLLSRQGVKIPVSASFSIRKDNKGNINGYFIGITDITILKGFQEEMEKKIIERTKDLEESRTALINILEDTEEARAKAEEEKVKTSTIFTNFIDGLLVFNINGKLSLVNPQAEKLLKVKEREIQGKKIEDLAKNKKTKSLIEMLDGKQKGIFRKELYLEEELILEITSTFISHNNKKIAFLVILHDITREKAIDKLKSQFVSVAAHQLRTPLSIIKWSLGMLLGGDIGKITKDQEQTVDKAFQTNERMIRLVNDLLNVSRIEEGRYVYQPKIVQFEELVKDICDSSKDRIKAKKISFKLNLGKSKKEKVVKVDVEKMTLAIKNLVDNAISYTPSGGEIEVKVKRGRQKIEFSIRDTGMGIPKKEQDKVFSRFFRGTNAVKKETEGTGLGLFISKNIIEAHDGKIWFESKEHKGTTFYFTLPTVV